MNDNLLFNLVSNFIIKFIKKQYAEAFVRGEICFNPAGKFNKKNGELTIGQYDPHDGFGVYNARKLLVYPIIEDTNDAYITDKPILLSNKCTVGESSEFLLKTPINCFYKPIQDEIIEHEDGYIVRLGNNLDKIKEAFNADSAVLIFDLIGFLNRLHKSRQFFQHIVYYGNKTAIESLKKENLLIKNYMQLFNKDDQYSYQHEFRIYLLDEKITDSLIIKLGDLSDVSRVINIDSLKNGLFFAIRKF